MMSDKNREAEEFDFDMDLNLDEDLDKLHQTPEESGLNEGASETLLDDSRPSFGDSYEQVTEEIESRNTKKSSGLSGGLIAGIVLGGVVTLGGLGWVGLQVFSPKGAPQQVAVAQNGAGGAQTGNQQVQPGTDQDAGSPWDVQAQQFENANNTAADKTTGVDGEFDDQYGFGGTAADSYEQDQAQWGESNFNTTPEPENEPDVQAQQMQGTYQASQTVSDIGPSSDDVVIRPPAISDEERMYDKLLAQAGAMDVPADAIVINQEVVEKQIEAKRFESLQSQVLETRESIADISQVITGIQTTIRDVSKVIESSNARQEALTDKIDALSSAMEASSASHSRGIQALEASIKNAQSEAAEAKRLAQSAKDESVRVASAQPVQSVGLAQAKAKLDAEEARKAEAEKIAVAKRAEEERARQQELIAKQQLEEATRMRELQARQLQANRAPVATPVAASVPVAQTVSPGQSCSASSSVSSVWRVKGVNSSSAYIVRPQDKTGLFVKEGVTVPGFGTAISFDPTNRTVCTTNGVIQR